MIDSFIIKNFRLFESLEIERFGRVNLIVGRNNSGKSALLEALEIFGTNASNTTLRKLLTAREEIGSQITDQLLTSSFENPLRHLFYGRKLPEVQDEGISLSIKSNPDEIITIEMKAFLETIEEGIVRKRMLSKTDFADLLETDELEFVATVQFNGRYRRIPNLDIDNLGEEGSMKSAQLIQPRFPVQVVPTKNMSGRTIASRWDSVGLTPLSKEVINGLNLMAPSITGIQFVANTSATSRVRIPQVSLSDHEEPVPLKSLGEGVSRLFHIIVALVTAKNGILLIDEFENGLHWSVQTKIWEIVFRLASELNVQVFATSHSRDCVEAFQEAWKTRPEEEGAFIRLQRSAQGEICAKTYNLETLSDSIETEVEVR